MNEYEPQDMFVRGRAVHAAIIRLGHRMESRVAMSAYGDIKSLPAARERLRYLRSRPVSTLGTVGISPRDEAQRLCRTLGVSLSQLQYRRPRVTEATIVDDDYAGLPPAMGLLP